MTCSSFLLRSLALFVRALGSGGWAAGALEDSRGTLPARGSEAHAQIILPDLAPCGLAAGRLGSRNQQHSSRLIRAFVVAIGAIVISSEVKVCLSERVPKDNPRKVGTALP